MAQRYRDAVDARPFGNREGRTRGRGTRSRALHEPSRHLKYPSGSAVDLHPEEDGWLAAWAGLEPARDLFLHAVKPGGGLEPPNLRLTRALAVPRGRSVRLRRRSGTRPKQSCS